MKPSQVEKLLAESKPAPKHPPACFRRVAATVHAPAQWERFIRAGNGSCREGWTPCPMPPKAILLRLETSGRFQGKTYYYDPDGNL